MSVFWFRLRVLSVHTIYLVYSTLLWWKLIYIGEQTGHPKFETLIALAVWGVVYIMINGIFLFSALTTSPSQFLLYTWCNVPLLTFVGFNLPPYGFTLKHLYKVTENKHFVHIGKGNQTCAQPSNLPMTEFIILQAVMPVLLVTFIVYPLPNRGFTSSEYLAIALEFMNAFDIMDMVGDFAYVDKYGSFWIVLYYLSLGISVILIAIPIKIEQEDFIWPRKFVICSHSDVNNGDDGKSVSMCSILTVPYVIDTGESRQRRLSISPGVYIDESVLNHNSDLPVAWIDENILQQSNSKNAGNEDVFIANKEKLSKERETKVIFRESDAISSQSVIKDEYDDRSKQNSQKKSERHTSNRYTNEVWRKLFKVILTVVFMDISFATIRFKIMLNENSADYGFNMFVKNVILATLHISYLLQHVKTLIATKLHNML